MKPITIFAILLLLILNKASSQNCSGITIDKKDEFTGMRVKVSKTKILKKGTYQIGFIEIKKEADSLKLTFIYSNNTTRLVNASLYTAKRGDKIYFLFDDGSVLALDLAGEVFAAREESANVGTEILLGSYAGLAKSNKFIFEPEYRCLHSDLEALAAKKVVKVRVVASGIKADTGQKVENIEFGVAPANAQQLMDDANCMLK